MGLLNMLSFADLYALSTFVDLGEHRLAKKVAARILAQADIAELWTIAHCAAILDGSAAHVADAKLTAFANSLTDDHRRALVTFCAAHTGQRTRRTLIDAVYPLFGLSIYHDTRPGYDQNDAQPAGLTVHPTPWETRQARTMAELTRHLRDDARQLPPEMRAPLRVVDTDTRAAARRTRRSRAEQRAARIADDYMRTRLGVQDRTAPGMRTIFDVDDDTPAPVELPDGYTLDYDRAAQNHVRVTPCVWCFIERRPQDAPRNRHDDGLCGECREHQRPGLPAPTSTAAPSAARTVAYLNPAARAHAARAAAITAPCAAVAAYLPRAAALVWIRAYYRLASDAERATIQQWVTAWRDANQPQPPTPAPVAPIQPTPALAAA
jgi:hypothetical protein